METMHKKADFIDACRFAKFVNTKSGPALLIGDQVIEVRGELYDFAEWLADALRTSQPRYGAQQGSCDSNLVGPEEAQFVRSPLGGINGGIR